MLEKCSEEKKEKRKIFCEVYSRIVGYLRPVQNWNEGKKQEFADRQTYSLNGGKWNVEQNQER